ncbi:ENR1 protein, partial [Regulus satrapa]|nr:ENR1 protein [Regulus satrapa]
YNKTNLCWHRSPGANPYQSISHQRFYWEEPDRIDSKWKAPDGIHWICGQRAYSELLQKWEGTCTLGIIRSSFFFIPRSRSNTLGTPL